MKIEREQVAKIYDEVDRRIDLLIRDDVLDAEQIREERISMLQGVYSTLMAISSNWPDVRYWCDQEEEERNYFPEADNDDS